MQVLVEGAVMGVAGGAVALRARARVGLAALLQRSGAGRGRVGAHSACVRARQRADHNVAVGGFQRPRVVVGQCDWRHEDDPDQPGDDQADQHTQPETMAATKSWHMQVSSACHTLAI